MGVPPPHFRADECPDQRGMSGRTGFPFTERNCLRGRVARTANFELDNEIHPSEPALNQFRAMATRRFHRPRRRSRHSAPIAIGAPAAKAIQGYMAEDICIWYPSHSVRDISTNRGLP